MWVAVHGNFNSRCRCVAPLWQKILLHPAVTLLLSGLYFRVVSCGGIVFKKLYILFCRNENCRKLSSVHSGYKLTSTSVFNSVTGFSSLTSSAELLQNYCQTHFSGLTLQQFLIRDLGEKNGKCFKCVRDVLCFNLCINHSLADLSNSERQDICIVKTEPHSGVSVCHLVNENATL